MATVISMDTELGHSPRYGEQRLLPSAFPRHNLNWSPLFLTVDVLLPIHPTKMKPNDIRNSSDNHLVLVVCGGFLCEHLFPLFYDSELNGFGFEMAGQTKQDHIVFCGILFHYCSI